MSTKDWMAREGWSLVLLLLGFVAVGLLSGWLVGQRRAPVVSALLPLAVGLLGGFTYALFDRRVTVAGLFAGLEKSPTAAQLLPGQLDKIKEEIGKEGDASLRVPAFWAVCIVAFCLAAYDGLERGVKSRVPQYPSIPALLGDRKVPPDQRALLYQLEVACKSAGLSATQYEELMRSAILPLLDEPAKTEYPGKEARLRAIVDGFRQTKLEDVMRPVGKNMDEVPLAK